MINKSYQDATRRKESSRGMWLVASNGKVCFAKGVLGGELGISYKDTKSNTETCGEMLQR